MSQNSWIFCAFTYSAEAAEGAELKTCRRVHLRAEMSHLQVCELCYEAKGCEEFALGPEEGCYAGGRCCSAAAGGASTSPGVDAPATPGGDSAAAPAGDATGGPPGGVPPPETLIRCRECRNDPGAGARRGHTKLIKDLQTATRKHEQIESALETARMLVRYASGTGSLYEECKDHLIDAEAAAETTRRNVDDANLRLVNAINRVGGNPAREVPS